MRIISWNTNGIRATYKQGYFEPLFDTYNPDIVCLQEVKAEPEQLLPDLLNFHDYKAYFAPSLGRKGYSGVAIYTKTEPIAVTIGINNPGFDTEGRTITAEYEDFYLVNCYFPNGGGGPERLAYKLAFYEAFLLYIEDLKQYKSVMFCGDVNVAHTEIDIARPKENVMNTGFLPVERAWMDRIVASDWIDVFRALYPDARDVYTYWDQITRARERNVGWRIDYFFVSPELFTNIKKFQTLTDYYGSDHCPILIDIEEIV